MKRSPTFLDGLLIACIACTGVGWCTYQIGRSHRFQILTEKLEDANARLAEHRTTLRDGGLGEDAEMLVALYEDILAQQRCPVVLDVTDESTLRILDGKEFKIHDVQLQPHAISHDALERAFLGERIQIVRQEDAAVDIIKVDLTLETNERTTLKKLSHLTSGNQPGG